MLEHAVLPEGLVEQICNHLSEEDQTKLREASSLQDRLSESVINSLTDEQKIEISQFAGRHNEDAAMLQLVPSIVLASIADPVVGVKAMLSACAESKVQAVAGLLDGGVSANAGIGGVSALMEAADGRDYTASADIVQLLIQSGASVHSVDIRGRTALHLAAARGNTLVIKALLEAGCDVNQRAKGVSPILIASEKKQYKAVELLIEKGANVNDQDGVGRSSLIWAADHSSPALVQLLISKGADLNHTNMFGKAALLLASENGSMDVVKLLVDAGCDVRIKDNLGKTASDYCSPGFPWTKVKKIISEATVKSAL
ncbi:ankyrin repeat-containing domain protein [Aspergillus aurantiobrunneus]